MTGFDIMSIVMCVWIVIDIIASALLIYWDYKSDQRYALVEANACYNKNK